MVSQYNPNVHHRRSIRLKGYDYAQAGAYFVTVCTQHRECLFGAIDHGEMALNEFGRIIRRTWNDLVNHNANISLGEFVIMPNHIHGIVIILPVGAGSKPAILDAHGGAAESLDGPGLDRAGLDRAGLHRAGLEPAPSVPGMG